MTVFLHWKLLCPTTAPLITTQLLLWRWWAKAKRKWAAVGPWECDLATISGASVTSAKGLSSKIDSAQLLRIGARLLLTSKGQLKYHQIAQRLTTRGQLERTKVFRVHKIIFLTHAKKVTSFSTVFGEKKFHSEQRNFNA